MINPRETGYFIYALRNKALGHVAFSKNGFISSDLIKVQFPTPSKFDKLRNHKLRRDHWQTMGFIHFKNKSDVDDVYEALYRLKITRQENPPKEWEYKNKSGNIYNFSYNVPLHTFNAIADITSSLKALLGRINKAKTDCKTDSKSDMINLNNIEIKKSFPIDIYWENDWYKGSADRWPSSEFVRHHTLELPEKCWSSKRLYEGFVTKFVDDLVKREKHSQV